MLHISNIIYLFFSFLLTSLCMTDSRSIHISINDPIPFLFIKLSVCMLLETWVISSPWVWVGFTDLLLVNRIWQKWWDLDAKRLLFQFGGVPLSLALKETSGHVVNALWSPCGKELMSLDTSQWGLEFCQQPWDWTRTVQSNLEMMAAWPDLLMELVWDPEPEATS